MSISRSGIETSFLYDWPTITLFSWSELLLALICDAIIPNAARLKTKLVNIKVLRFRATKDTTDLFIKYLTPFPDFLGRNTTGGRRKKERSSRAFSLPGMPILGSDYWSR